MDIEDGKDREMGSFRDVPSSSEIYNPNVERDGQSLFLHS
jgi:hypothetical protein